MYTKKFITIDREGMFHEIEAIQSISTKIITDSTMRPTYISDMGEWMTATEFSMRGGRLSVIEAKYNCVVINISDQCKTPDFREKFREAFKKPHGIRYATLEEAPETLKLNFKYENNVGTEMYTIDAIKTGRTYVDGNRAVAYIVHPINLKYEGCYL